MMERRQTRLAVVLVGVVHDEIFSEEVPRRVVAAPPHVGKVSGRPPVQRQRPGASDGLRFGLTKSGPLRGFVSLGLRNSIGGEH